MAAGDIILSDGTTITPEDLQKIAAETKKILAAESKELSQYEEVSSLSNLTSLPGIFQSGSTMKLVRVALSVLKGIDGKTVELSASSTAIQWRYVGESEWNTLIDIALLKGDKGDAGEKVVLRKGESGIEWKYESEEDTAYKTLVSMDDIKLKYSDLSEADKAELTKKPILAKVNAQSGSTPSGSFASDGEDENGNPKYILNLTVQKGDKGEPPVFEVGSVTTGLPSSEASVELTPNGETPEGNPKYIMDISIPKGEPGQNGEGSGNVYATETGLEAGKTYLFRPSAPNSASGTFVLYEAPDTSQFITNAVNNLVNYYLKAETYSREEINSLLGQMSSISFEVVDSLPASGKSNTIYLVKKDGSENDVHDEYIWVEGKWEIIGSTAITLTKESIEKVFTGNIESHTHNSTYEYTEFETDVWDGSTISESLQGAGTKDDPYLIQSCADLLYVRANITTYKGSDSLIQFKLTKSLDFGNKTIPVLEEPSDAGSVLEFDGNNATISNFIFTELTLGIFGSAQLSFFHSFILRDITSNCVLTSDGALLGFFCGANDMYNIITNNAIKGKIIIGGELAGDIMAQSVIMSGFMATGSAPSLASIVDDYLEANGYYGAFEIQIEDNTIKNGHKLMVLNTLVPPSATSATKELTGYDFSVANATSADDMAGTFEGDVLIATALTYMNTSSTFYRNSEKSHGFIYMDSESNISFVTSPSKTTEEMLSDSFVEELNSKFSSPVFVKDKNGGTPVLAPKNAKLKYDGYVRQSEFEDFKAKINLSPVNPESPFVDIEFIANYFPEHNSTVELTQEQYDTIHKELINGKILRINAMCGIFFGTSNLFIGSASGSDLDKEEYQKASECFVNILVGDVNAIINADSNISEGVTNQLFTIKISKTANETGKHIATFYKAKDLVSSDEVTIIKKLTQSEYDGLSTKKSSTLYLIVE